MARERIASQRRAREVAKAEKASKRLNAAGIKLLAKTPPALRPQIAYVNDFPEFPFLRYISHV